MDHTGNGGGSIHISHLAASGDTIIVPETFAPGSGIWWNGTPYDLSTYTNISCYFKWDDAGSTMSIANFNTQGTGGFGVGYSTPSAWDQLRLPSQPVAADADVNWQHFNFPLNDTMVNINAVGGVEYVDWKPAPWSGDVAFWVDDVTIQQGHVVIPPPLIKPLTKASSGLYVFNGSSGNTYYDRQEVYCITNTGVDWYANATAGNPVTYSFTIKSMPEPYSATAGAEAWMFLSPNPAGLEGAPDWNEANMIIAFVQNDTNDNATLHLQYKVNEASQQNMYSGASEVDTDGSTYTNNVYWTNAVGSLPGGPVTTPIAPGINQIDNETGNLLAVTNNGSAAGTWSITFTSPTNVTVTSPSGNSGSAVITPYNANFLNPAGVCRIYLGGQANNAASLDKAIVYSSFQLTGTPNAINDNFAADLTLDTNTWSTSVATKPVGVLIAPSTVKYLATWTIPAFGYALEAGNQLRDVTTWGSPTMYPVMGFNAVFGQFVDSTEVPVGPNAFFNLIQRAFTQLQVILPGETAAPGTPSGKTGTPTPVSEGAGGFETVTVNAVDSTWHLISGIGDTVELSSSDLSALLPGNTALANGTVTFAPLQFNTTGPQTVTATDFSDGSKLPNISTPVTVGP